MEQLGRFLVLNAIGAGNALRVWDTFHSRTVTLYDVPLAATSNADRLRAQIAREARTASSLSHPGIVPVLGWEQVEGRDVLIAGSIDGPTLAHLLIRDDSLDLPQGIRIWREAAAALDHAHANGLFHLRLDTRSLLLDRDGQTRIAAFGLARLMEEETTRSSAGEPLQFASPELLRGETPDGRADQYALAAIVYLMLTNRAPFAEASGAARNELPVPPSQLRPRLSGAVDAALARALSPRPDQRFASCSAFVEALVAGLNRPNAAPASAVATPVPAQAPVPVEELPTLQQPVAVPQVLSPPPTPVATLPRPEPASSAPGDGPLSLLNTAPPRREFPFGLVFLGLTLLAMAGLAYTYWPSNAAPAYVPAAVLEGHQNAVVALSLAPDNTRLASGGSDRVIRLWNVTANTAEQALPPVPYPVTGLAFSSDGGLFVSSGSLREATLWDATTWTKTRSLQAAVPISSNVALSVDGESLVVGTQKGGVELWSASTGKPVRRWQGHDAAVLAVAVSDDGTRIATAGGDQIVKLWDVETGDGLATFTGHTGDVSALAFYPDGQRLASGSSDKTIRVWPTSGGAAQLTLEGHTGSVFAVAVSGDGKTLASGGADSSVRVWNAATGAPITTLTGHTSAVTSVEMGRTGDLVISGSSDKTVRTWRRPAEQ